MFRQVQEKHDKLKETLSQAEEQLSQVKKPVGSLKDTEWENVLMGAGVHTDQLMCILGGFSRREDQWRNEQI